MKNRILIFVLISILAATSSFFLLGMIIDCVGSDEENLPEILLEGDWYYYLGERDYLNGAHIVGISDSAKQKEVLIIPYYINSAVVQTVTYSLDYCTDKIDSGKLKTVYFLGDAFSIEGFSNVQNLEKFVVMQESYDIYKKSIGVDYGLTNIYFCRDTLEYPTGKVSGRTNLYYANVSYLYNYDGANNNGFYWVDNYDYGEKIEFVPENPTREGYTFGGWYKEESCENKWDFNNDRLPEIKKGTQEETLYQETKLYAKWIAN